MTNQEINNDSVQESRNKKSANKKGVLLVFIVIILILIAVAVFMLKKNLSPKKAADTSVSETTTAAVTVDPAQNAATFAEYKDTLEKIFESINMAIASTDMDNEQEVIALIDKIKPYYDQVSTLTPPQGLEETDAKLKEGCQKSSETLQLSKEILTIGDDPTADDIVKVSSLQSHMNDLNAVQTQIEDALNIIYNTTTDQLNKQGE